MINQAFESEVSICFSVSDEILLSNLMQIGFYLNTVMWIKN